MEANYEMIDCTDGRKVFLDTPQVRIASITTTERPTISAKRVGHTAGMWRRNYGGGKRPWEL